jgi:hypothetical protein
VKAKVTTLLVGFPGQLSVADAVETLERAGLRGWQWVSGGFDDVPVVLERIAQAHCQQTGEGGVTDGMCAECGWIWPCATHRWATGAVEDLDGTWEQDGGNVRRVR